MSESRVQRHAPADHYLAGFVRTIEDLAPDKEKVWAQQGPFTSRIATGDTHSIGIGFTSAKDELVTCEVIVPLESQRGPVEVKLGIPDFEGKIRGGVLTRLDAKRHDEKDPLIQHLLISFRRFVQGLELKDEGAEEVFVPTQQSIYALKSFLNSLYYGQRDATLTEKDRQGKSPMNALSIDPGDPHDKRGIFRRRRKEQKESK